MLGKRSVTNVLLKVLLDALAAKRCSDAAAAHTGGFRSISPCVSMSMSVALGT